MHRWLASIVTGNSHTKYRGIRASRTYQRYEEVPSFEMGNLLLHSLFGIHCGHPRRVHNRRRWRLWRRKGRGSRARSFAAASKQPPRAKKDLKTDRASERPSWGLYRSPFLSWNSCSRRNLSYLFFLFLSFAMTAKASWLLGRGRAEGVELPPKKEKIQLNFTQLII